VGAFHGYNKGIDRDADNRSSLLWQVERILKERFELKMCMPKFLLLENVPALLAERHKNNFNEWKQILKEMGYHSKVYKLNALDFGLPQNRERVLMISILTKNNSAIENTIDEYFDNNDLQKPEYRKELNIQQLDINKALKTDYNNTVYLNEAIECQPNDTVSRRNIWEKNLKITDLNGNIISDKVATLTTKQDRHPNSGNLKVNFDNGKSSFRYLTPRECFILMGFYEEDYERLIDNNVHIRSNAMLFSRDKLIRLAGNSIAVNVLEAIFTQIEYINKNILQNNNE